MMRVRMVGLWLFLFLLGFGILAAHVQAQDANYLPLSLQYKWVMRNARQEKPFIVEVVQQEGGGFRVRSTTPWGMSEWTLVENNQQFFMTGYGTGRGMMPIPEGTLFFDFSRPAGTKWSNSLGELTILFTTLTVKSAANTYRDCVQIRHKYPGGSTVFAFAKGVGFVQFGEGSDAFVLDESDSSLPGLEEATPPQPASQPYPRPRAQPRSSGGQGRPLIGLTVNRVATDPETVDAMIKRFDQTLQTGVNFIVANGNWTELEPQQGQYKLDSLNYLLSVSKQMPVSFTLRIIDTVGRNVPPDLRRTRWNDSKMRSRLFRLIDAMAPLLRGRVRWFMLGYELNEYMNRHPKEAGEFIELYRAAADHLRKRVPGIKVSSTLMFSGIDQLERRLARLNEHLDFLALTYSPLEPDFSVQDPSVLPRDFQRMRQVAAGRKIVLQEIGYPSSPIVKSSEDKQAKFYQLAFQQLDRDSQAFEAVNWMMLADLSDATTKHYSQFYGLKDVAKFEAALQTLGVFDTRGKPKKSWAIFREHMRR